MSTRGLGDRRTYRGFTLVELVVVIGIVSALGAMLLPAISAARAQARGIVCQNNVRQLLAAFAAYASENRGKYPPNVASSIPARVWYDQDRIGHYLKAYPLSGSGVVGGVAVCPSDERACRSYAMNVWASSQADPNVMREDGKLGRFWTSTVPNGSRMILIAEKWASKATPWGLVTDEPFGFDGATTPQRFGAKGGISPPIGEGPWGWVNCELPFMRHRGSNGPGSGTQARGRVTIGYADYHVEQRSDSDLVTSSGLSTLDSVWSPLDGMMNH